MRFRLSNASRWFALGAATALMASALPAQVSVSQNAQRSQVREFYVSYTLFDAPDLVAKDINIPGFGTNDAIMDFEKSDLWGIGFGYGLNDKLNVNFEFNFGSVDYKMLWGDDILRGSGDMFNGRLNLDYNLLKRAITPFVTGGIGWNYFDSGVPSDNPEYVCWWDPWWGYICDGYINTHSSSNFTWNLGVGLRWDVTDGFYAKALYDVMWMEVGASGTEAFPQYQLLVGWKW